MQVTRIIRPKFREAASVSLMTVVLTGCASLISNPEPTRVEPPAAAIADVPPPQDWVVPAPDALPTTDWVRAFPDPILIEFVDEALRENTDIGVAYAALDASIALEKISRADRLPIIGANVDISRSEFANEFLNDNTNIGVGLNASWEPDLWGRIADRIGASELASEAAASDVAGARLSITGQVAQTWFGLIEAKLLVDLSEREIETQERALRLTQRRFQSGLSGSEDVRLVRSSVAQAQALQASRRQNLDLLSRQLEILLTRYPASALEASSDLPELPPLTGAGAPSYILTQRPDLIAAERRLAEQGFEIDLAKKALRPSLSLSGATSGSGGGLESLFDIDALVANLASNLSAPIFQGGRLRANVEVQEAILRQQLQSYIGTVLQAYFDVENALDSETRLEETERALRVAVDESLEAENRLALRYTEGLATILQLLDAQTRRLSAEGQLISARAERLQNRVRLHLALGGGAYGNIPPDAFPAFLRDQG